MAHVYPDDPSRIAGENLTGKQYHFVKLNASDEVVLCDAITDKAFGVLQNEGVIAGKEALVRTFGSTKVVSEAALSIGDDVAPSTNSKGQVAVSTQFARGRVVGASSGADIMAVIDLYNDATAIA
jgi:hypothetical protein